MARTAPAPALKWAIVATASLIVLIWFHTRRKEAVVKAHAAHTVKRDNVTEVLGIGRHSSTVIFLQCVPFPFSSLFVVRRCDNARCSFSCAQRFGWTGSANVSCQDTLDLGMIADLLTAAPQNAAGGLHATSIISSELGDAVCVSLRAKLSLPRV